MAKKKDHEPLQRWTPPAETFSNSNIQQSSNTSNVKYERDEAKASRSGGNSLFNAAKRFLSANDDAAEMTYGVYNPTAKQRSTLGNVVAAGGRSWRAGQRNALAALLDPTDDGSATDAEMMFYTPGAKQTLSEMENNSLANWLKKQRGTATEKLSKSADELSAEAQEAEETAKDGKSKVSKLLIDAGIAGVQLGLDVGVGAATGTGTLSMGTRTFGQSYKEATGAGANQQQAFNYAASAAGVEMLTEKIFDVAKLFGGGAADDAIEKAVGKWAKTDAGKTALRSFFAAATEGGEEVASDLVNPLIREFYQSGAAKEAFFTKEGLKNLASDAGRDAIIGAMLGGLGNVANVGNNAQKNNLIQQREAAEAAEVEAQRMADFNQRQQLQRDYFSGNAMQTGTADAEAAAVLNRNARGRGEAAMIAEIMKASNVDPDTALKNLQAFEAQQNAAQQAPAVEQAQQPAQPQNVTQAAPEPQTVQPTQPTAEQDLNTVRESIGRNPTWDDLISHYSQQGEAGGQAYQRISEAFERGDLVDTGNSGIYTRAEIEQRQTSMPESDHIDNRTAADIANTKVNAFQHEHPELHNHFVTVAQKIINEAGESIDRGVTKIPKKYGGGTQTYYGNGIRSVMNQTNLSRQKIIAVCQDIINNHGSENYADAKRVEIALDNLMSGMDEAYSDAEYLRKKGQITGGLDPNSWEYAWKTSWENVAAMENMTEEEAKAQWERDRAFEAEQAQQTQPEPVSENNAQTEPPANPVTPESSVGAAQSGFNAEGEKLQERYDEAIEKYGAHPERSTLARQQEVPKQMNDESVVPRTVQSAIGAEITPSDAASDIADTVARGGFDRAVITDKESLSKAEAEIKDKGWDSALADWTINVKSGRVSKDNIALGLTLYNNAVNSGNTKAAVNILTDLVDNARAAAQAVQAMSLLQKLTPENRLYGVQRSVENLEQSLKDKFGDRAPELEIDRNLMEEYLNAKDDQGRADAMDKIYQNIADQIPASWSDKLNSWRYLAMLGNPRTHIRNIAGNLGFAPVRGVKNIVAAGLERVAIGKAGTEGRTKSFVPIAFRGAADTARYQAALDEWSEVEPLVQSGGKYNDDFGEIRNRQTIYNKVKPLETVRKKNADLLDMEDTWFSKPAYASSLAQYLKANNITAEQYNSPGFDKTAAREYAILEAQKSTYRDTNNFSETISKLGKTKFKPVNTLVEAILPFKKTPANILARGVEYSPIGLLNGIKQMTYDVQKGNKTAAEAIDTLASGLTGTGIMALGYFLASQGLLRGGKDEDKDQANFDSLQGHQPYSLEIGDTSITLDWLAPEALPLFVGVEFFNILEDGFEPGDNIFKPFQQISEPVLEMSMLSGINDVLDSITYSDSKTWAVLSSAATSYLSQYIPTIFGQIERVTEDTRQSTYTEKDSYIPTDIQYALGKAANKLPGEYNQMDYLNAWGEQQSTGNVFQRALSNFINPAYTSKITTSDVDRELARLNDKTGATDIYPANMYNQPAMKFDGEQKALTQKQKEAYQKVYGHTYKNMAQSLIQSGEYQALSDADKATSMKLVEQYAAVKGKQAVGADAEEPSWATKSEGTVQQNAVYNTMYQSAVKAYRENNGIPSDKKLSDMQIVSAIADKGNSFDTTLQLARQGISSDSTAVEKLEKAHSVYKIEPATWAQIYMSADTNGNNSITKAEAQAAVNAAGVDPAAYHLFNKSWK